MTVIVKRLANKKTRRETGLDYVTTGLNLLTPFGSGLIKEQKPFLPGQEELLRAELSRIQEIKSIAEANEREIGMLSEAFMMLKDNSLSIIKDFDVKTNAPAPNPGDVEYHNHLIRYFN